MNKLKYELNQNLGTVQSSNSINAEPNVEDSASLLSQFRSPFQVTADAESRNLKPTTESVFDLNELSKENKLDGLILKINMETNREINENIIDNSLQRADALKAKLAFQISRLHLILERLRSLQRNVNDAYSLAQMLTKSDVADDSIKKFSIDHLNKSTQQVETILDQI